MAEKERLSRETIAFRVAREFEDGMVVNLGIGIPTLCLNYPTPDKEILYQTENGCLNFGCNATPEEADFDLVNAGGQMVTTKQGMSLITLLTRQNFGIVGFISAIKFISVSVE